MSETPAIESAGGPGTELDVYDGYDIDEYNSPDVEEPIEAWATDLPPEDAELVDDDLSQVGDDSSLADPVWTSDNYGGSGGGGGGGGSPRRRRKGGGGGGGGGRGGFTLFAFDFLNNNSLAKTGDNSLIKTGGKGKTKRRGWWQ